MKTCPKCERMASDSISKCRGCGHPYPAGYTFVDEPTIRPDRKVQKSVIKESLTTENKQKRDHRNENNRKLSRLPDEEEGKFYISTFKQ